MGRRSDIKPLPSLERLNELFTYSPLTGELRWKSIIAARLKAAEELHGQFMRVA